LYIVIGVPQPRNLHACLAGKQEAVTAHPEAHSIVEEYAAVCPQFSQHATDATGG
jgi:hypothetical protein